MITSGGDCMEQRKRPSGTDGLGSYTSWEKSSENGCIYCGSPATTREHVPSKAFLVEPYPENLATVPACFGCNNGFSDDEKYVSCFLDVLKEAVYKDYVRRADTVRRLAKDDNLKKLLDEQIITNNGEVHYAFDEDRLCRILVKLAKGHAGFEVDHICFDDAQVSLRYGFVFNMSEEAIDEFEEIPQADIAPEVGSRGCITPFVVQNIETGEAFGFMLWNDVQEDQYRYQVSYNENGGICVQIVIYEMLYCRVDFN